MSKFIWEGEDDKGVTITPPDNPTAKLDAEIAKVDRQLRDAGVTDEEEAALAAEELGEEDAE